MAYIGNTLRTAQPNYQIIDDISASFDGSTTTFALQVGGATPVPFPVSAQHCMISVGGVIQQPDPTGTDGFLLSGSNIVFSAAPSFGEDFFGVVLAGADYINVGANFPDGSVATPSITFDQDTDTGLYRKGANNIAITTNGTERVSVGTSEVVFNDGGNDINFRIEGDTDSNLFFVDAGNDRVGIGTSSPAERLDIEASVSGGTVAAKIENTANTLGDEAELQLVTGSDNWKIKSLWNGGSLTFNKGSGEVARLDSSGRLLVGTSSASGGTTNAAVVIGAAEINSTGLRSLNANGTLDLTLLGTGTVGHLYVTSTLTSNAAVRTSNIYFISTRFGNSTAITLLNSDNGSSGGRSFSLTNPSGNTFRFTDTSGSACTVSMSFIGGQGF